MDEGRGKSRDEDGRERRGERRDRGGRKRERRGGRDTRDKDRGNKRIERTHRQSQSEKQDGSSHVSVHIKPPIILTKPMAEKALQDSQGKDQQPGVIAIQRRDDSSSIQSSLSVSLGASKPISIESSGKHDQTSNSDHKDASKVKHSSSAPAKTGSLGQGMVKMDQMVTGLAALQMTPQSTMQHSVKIVDDSFYWSDKALNSLLEQTDFVVVGVVGYQGTGKSTLLSLIGDSKNVNSIKSKLLFRPQSKQDVEKSLHRTEGIDIFVTSERLILLDSQPLLSPSILDRFLRHEKKVPSDFGTAETCIEMQSLQILTFLYAVCHVVVVVMDHFVDLSLLKFLKTAEMLKPSSVAHSGQDGPSSANSEDLDEYFPHVVFAYNRCNSDMFCLEQIQDMAQVTHKFFAHSRLKTRGSASIIRANLLPFCKLKPFYDYQDLNIYLLPEYENKENDTRSSSISAYHGHPSFSSLLLALRNQLLAMPRQHLTHHSLTERSWFHYAARTWDTIKKSPLLSEYQRMLTT